MEPKTNVGPQWSSRLREQEFPQRDPDRFSQDGHIVQTDRTQTVFNLAQPRLVKSRELFDGHLGQTCIFSCLSEVASEDQTFGRYWLGHWLGVTSSRSVEDVSKWWLSMLLPGSGAGNGANLGMRQKKQK